MLVPVIVAVSVAAAVVAKLLWTKLVVVQVGKIQLGIERVEVEVQGLPDTLNGVKLAQLSDIHMDPRFPWIMRFMTDDFLRKTMETINKEAPTLLLLTGDFIVKKKEAIHHLVPFLKLAKMPMYGILGNHDNYVSSLFRYFVCVCVCFFLMMCC